MIKRLAIVFLVIFSTLSTLAQSVTFTASAPLNVMEGSRFQVTLSLMNARANSFDEPKFEGLRVLSGPNINQSTSFHLSNGQMVSSSMYTYTYYVEALSSSKKATVSAASVVVGDKTYKTKPLTISIGNGGSGGNQSSGSTTQDNSQTKESNNRKQGPASDDILLRMHLSKESCYQGEAISMQIMIYTAVSGSRITNIEYPTLNGFWTQDIQVSTMNSTGRYTIGNKVYEGTVLRQWLLYPQKAGKITIEPTTIDLIARTVVDNDGTMLFNQFYGGVGTVKNVPLKLKTSQAVIDVKPLPEQGAPVGQPVAVGEFEISSILSDSTIKANSAASLTVTISGSGDFQLMELPQFNLPAEFEQYEVKVEDDLRYLLSGTTGSRVLEFPFVARSEGEYIVPSVEFAYFNPITKQYKVLSTPEYNLSVERDNLSSPLITGINREDLKILGEDIRYIITSELRSSGVGVMSLYSTTFFFIILITVIFAVLAIFLLKVQSHRKADVVGTKTRKASKVALRRLKSAKKQLDLSNRGQFFEETLKALWGFVGDRYSIEMAELTKQRIAEEFKRRGVDDSHSIEFISLVEECEMAQYAPSVNSEMEAIYRRVLVLFDAL